jgi:rubrerythrin
MRTSLQWWNDTKNDQVRLVDWLKKQYRGEVTAASRITRLAENYDATDKQKKLLNKIADDEMQHAIWIRELLRNRGIPLPSLNEAEDRYWAETLPGIEDFETGAAVGAHAEGMRLERIFVIANDVDAPEDIRNTFARILKDETFHEQAFISLTNEAALEKTRGNHALGLQALGLVH